MAHSTNRGRNASRPGDSCRSQGRTPQGPPDSPTSSRRTRHSPYWSSGRGAGASGGTGRSGGGGGRLVGGNHQVTADQQDVVEVHAIGSRQLLDGQAVRLGDGPEAVTRSHHVGMAGAGGIPGRPGADQQRQAGGRDGEPPAPRPSRGRQRGLSGSAWLRTRHKKGNWRRMNPGGPIPPPAGRKRTISTGASSTPLSTLFTDLA